MIKKTKRVVVEPKRQINNISIVYEYEDDDSISIVINIPAITSELDFIKYSNQLGTLLSDIHTGSLSDDTAKTINQYKEKIPSLSDFLEHSMIIWRALDQKESQEPVITPLSFDFDA